MYSFRSTAHTGENRCWPCTATNLAIAAVIAGALFLVSPLLGVAFFGVGVVLIAFRGYLVPGTPSLTRRYFPKRVLAWFGKAPPEPSDLVVDEFAENSDEEADTDPEVDVDRLVTVGALSVEDDDSLVLDPAFEDRWWSEVETLRNDERAQREAFAEIVGVHPGDVTFEAVPETGAFSVSVGDDNVSQWMSRAAFVADVAANETLTTIDPDWATLSLLDRHKLSMGLRQFLDTCPLCDAPFVEEREATESCCWSIQAITTRCTECGSRLYVV